MEITPKSLSELTGGYVEGDENAKITGFAKIEEAGEGDLTFIANPKYFHHITNTKATAVLVSKDFEVPEGVSATLIRVDDPYSSLAFLMSLVQQSRPLPIGIEQPVHIAEGVIIPDSCYIGSFSYIGSSSQINENVKIYPQCYVGENVTIGENTILYPGVKIYSGCKIGKNCRIHSGAVIGADGFGFAPTENGYEKIPQMGIVILEDDVEIGANTTIDRATLGVTRIGKGTKLDNLIQIAHNVEVGENNVFAAQTGVAGSTRIGSWNRVGGQCGFAGHIKVGDNNEFGAQSGIPNNVGDGKRLIGYPAMDALQFARNAVYMKRLGELFNKKQK